jgi:hypothetical protein
MTGHRMQFEMSKAQKVVLVIYALAVAALCVYAPWVTRTANSQLERGLIWSPPENSVINIYFLSVEICTVSIVAGAAFLFFKYLKD